MEPNKGEEYIPKDGLSGWDKNAVKDIQAVSTLESILASDERCRFYSVFSKNDKTPNYDGCLLIGEKSDTGNRNTPIGQFEVQIKTLSEGYQNESKTCHASQYKYSCKAAVIYAVARYVSENPTLLFLVDTTQHVAFCKHLLPAYWAEKIHENQQGSYTIYFNDRDCVQPLDSFYEKLVDIKKSVNSSPAILVDPDIPLELRIGLADACLSLNSTLDNDLRFIKRSVLPNTKRLGIACNVMGDNAMTRIFSLHEDEEGHWVRSFNLDGFSNSTDWVKDQNDLLVIKEPMGEFFARERTDFFIKLIIEDFCREHFLPAYSLTNECLYEIIFYFLDTVAKRFRSKNAKDTEMIMYEDDSITVKEVEKIWRAVRDSELYRLEETIPEELVSDNPLDEIMIDPLKKQISGINKKWISSFEKALMEPFANYNVNIKLKGEFPYSLVDDAIAELKNRNVKTVTRLWQKYNVKMAKSEWADLRVPFQIDRGYTKDAYYGEFQKLLGLVEESYTKATAILFESASTKYIEKGTWEFFVDPTTRDASLELVHWDNNAPLSMKYVEGNMPSIEPASDVEIHRIMSFNLNFTRLPLYTMLEYFLTRKMKIIYGINVDGSLPDSLKKIPE